MALTSVCATPASSGMPAKLQARISCSGVVWAVRAFCMIVLGLLLSMVGADVNSGELRFTFGIPELSEEIGLVAVAMGMFGISEILHNLEHELTREPMVKSVTGLMPTREDLRRIIGPICRGTLLGSALGILPGGGAILSSFTAYSLEKKLSRDQSRFGKGAIEGVAAPESANNAGAQTSFIPMLTLGIPPNPVMALMFGAMIIQGIVPGPSVMTERPDLFWGIIVSMWVGNLMLVILNLPMIGLWVRLLRVPYHLLYPAILVFCCIGVYSVRNVEFDVYLMALFGLLGYVLVKLDCEPAPLLMGFILGDLFEEYLRRAMILSRGDPMVFIERPISATMLVLSLVALIIVLSPAIRRKREEVFQEDS